MIFFNHKPNCMVSFVQRKNRKLHGYIFIWSKRHSKQHKKFDLRKLTSPICIIGLWTLLKYIGIGHAKK